MAQLDYVVVMSFKHHTLGDTNGNPKKNSNNFFSFANHFFFFKVHTMCHNKPPHFEGYDACKANLRNKRQGWFAKGICGFCLQ